MANELENTVGTETTTPPAEESAKVKALESEIAKLKQAVTNASADASSWKKQFKEADDALKAKMTEAERAEKERAEANAAMQTELETLRNERNIANYKAQYVSIGFDDALAQETAEALNGGDHAKVFDGIRKFIDIHDRALAEKAMLNNPTLPGGDSPKPITLEQFKAMDITEMGVLKQEHPELYKEFISQI